MRRNFASCSSRVIVSDGSICEYWYPGATSIPSMPTSFVRYSIIARMSSTSVSLKTVVLVVTRNPRPRASLIASTAMSQRPG
jgi:hypothetical protein